MRSYISNEFLFLQELIVISHWCDNAKRKKFGMNRQMKN